MNRKYLFLMVLAGGLISQLPMFAATSRNVRELDRNQNGIYEDGEVDPNCEYPCGPCECICPYTSFKPVYYYTTRCEKEPYTVQKKCCRYVPKYYTKQYCRYVPQYYTKEYCRQVPEYYCVDETRYRTKTVRDKHCRYVPCTYTKRTCVDAGAVCPTCPSGNYPSDGGYYNGRSNGQIYDQPERSNGQSYDNNGRSNGQYDQNGRSNGRSKRSNGMND